MFYNIKIIFLLINLLYLQSMKVSKVLNISKENNVATINIVGNIGIPARYQSDNEGIVSSADDLRNELKAFENIGEVDKIVLNIDSLGGSVSHALAIYNILKSHKAEKFVNYIGISASASTIIGSVAPLENITIANNLSILVHEARNESFGTIKQHEANIADLKTLNDLIAQTYSNLNGKSLNKNLAIMQENNGEGRLLSPKEAKKLGFVGQIIDFKENTATASIKDLEACGWSQCNINRLEKFNNNLKFEQMGIFNKNKKNVLDTLEFGENTLIFGELKVGENVKLAGKTDMFTGDFDFQNKKVSVIDDVITEVFEKSEKDKEIEALKNEISEKDAEIENIKNAKIEVSESEKDKEIEALKKDLEAKEKIIADAKLEVSNPKLPKGEFKDDKNETKKTSYRDVIKRKYKNLQN